MLMTTVTFSSAWINSIIPEGTTDVNIFYAPDTIDNLGGILFTLENILGSLFAAAHISMWYNHFPTYRDMMVWRIASLATVALPSFSYSA
jgi:hypothetical protein